MTTESRSAKVHSDLFVCVSSSPAEASYPEDYQLDTDEQLSIFWDLKSKIRLKI